MPAASMPAASAASFRGEQAARRPRAAPSAVNPVTARRRAASQPGRVRLPSGAKGSVVTVSVILPAKNEAEGLRRTLPALRERMPAAEIIVVDDGSTDDTAEVAAALGARVLGSPYSMGNGAAIKRGARAAPGELLVSTDSGGQHYPTSMPNQ